MKEPTREPNPGSKEAIAKGCRCPVIDNHYGKGIPTEDGLEFWYSADCPVHNKAFPKSN